MQLVTWEGIICSHQSFGAWWEGSILCWSHVCLSEYEAVIFQTFSSSFSNRNSEGAALYFVCGVCIDHLTLAALVMRISLPHRLLSAFPGVSEGPRKAATVRMAAWMQHLTSRSGDIGALKGLWTRMSSLRWRSWSSPALEERERIIREIWMNGQPEVPGTRSLNRYY